MSKGVDSGLRRIFLGLAYLLAACGCGGGGSSNSSFSTAIATAYQAVGTDYNSTRVGAYGAVVAVSCPQGTWTQAFGWADANGTKMQANMQYRIASVTKTFTAMAILELAQNGRLSLNDHVSLYIGNPSTALYPDWKDITIGQLANHTSGIEDVNTASAPFDSDQAETPMQVLMHGKQANSAGAVFDYANVNFTILGLVIQQVTGLDPGTFFQQEFIQPLGLSSTTFATDGSTPTLACQGFNGAANVTTWNPSCYWGSGNMVSSVTDLTKWIRAVFKQTLLDSSFQGVLLREVSPSSEGFGIEEYGGWLGHTGRILGYSSACFYNPAIDASVVVMVNREDWTDGTVSSTTNVAREYFILNDVIDSFFPGYPTGLLSQPGG